MFDLASDADVGRIIGIAAGVGAGSSLVAEFLVPRLKTKEAGAFQLPKRISRRYLDFGSLAAFPVGALAAIIAALLFAPAEARIVDERTVRDVELARLILISAVAGLSGAAFLTLVQERFLALAKSERLDALLGVASDTIKQSTDPDAIAAATKALTEKVQETIAPALREAAEQTIPSELVDSLRSEHMLESVGGIAMIAPRRRFGRPIRVPLSWSDQDVEARARKVVDEIASASEKAVTDHLRELKAVARQIDEARRDDE